MRYSYNVYKDITLDSLQKKLGEENVRLVEIPQNNGVKLQGVQLNMETDVASPMLYFNNKKEFY